MYDTAYPQLDPRALGTQKYVAEALHLAGIEWAREVREIDVS